VKEALDFAARVIRLGMGNRMLRLAQMTRVWSLMNGPP
jgi:hypothetical protein